MKKFSFETLAKFDPKIEMYPQPDNGEVTGTFWEDLYQLFKERFIAETSDGKTK